ncbi:polysaccharide deacetylase family protein [Alkalibacter rhizosphaerae]|uniref:Polysaccharide deacetylase family protein n=1 Tax=Alkalibacter rhizosphaerae TaxID=2815577 RepID=A0A974XHZ0_9FIRM|nr:polysaccharide deacetylase family protein [Alkalibacter rhizosphaerae]QSX09020.1 polysaccharide deacetylase family protein [Alkalibacter rhizosphaerae]
MNEYTLNFIEILRVYKELDAFFMEMRLHHGMSSSTSSIKIDEEMYFVLDKLVSKDHGRSRYRLSRQFHRLENVDKWLGSLSVTQLDTSQTIHFPCTENFVRQVYLANEKNKKTQNNNGANDRRLHQPSEKKKHSFFSKKTGFFSLLFIAAFSFIFLSNGIIANSGNSEKGSSDLPVDAPYGSEAFPSLNETQEIFFEKADSSAPVEDKSIKIATLIQIPVPENSKSVVLLEDVRSRFLPMDTIALTFDDGPSVYTKKIADILTSYNVGGTFFFLGENVKGNEYLLRYIHKQGFALGNHSFSHPYFKSLSKEDQWSQIEQTNDVFRKIIGVGTHLFRPPYGSMNRTTFELLEEKEMKIVLWSKDTEDWKVNNAQELVEYTKENVTGGSIILFHEKERTVEALPEIIEYLQDKGLKIVNLR